MGQEQHACCIEQRGYYRHCEDDKYKDEIVISTQKKLSALWSSTSRRLNRCNLTFLDVSAQP
jgi:hypothetical protein